VCIYREGEREKERGRERWIKGKILKDEDKKSKTERAREILGERERERDTARRERERGREGGSHTCREGGWVEERESAHARREGECERE